MSIVLSNNESNILNNIKKQVDNSIDKYPNHITEQDDKYYAVGLYLTKLEMLLLQKVLNN